MRDEINAESPSRSPQRYEYTHLGEQNGRHVSKFRFALVKPRREREKKKKEKKEKEKVKGRREET